MSFICGLSTMATLIEPPFPPEAGVPLEVPPELELFEPPPPQPVASVPTTANRAAAEQRRTVPLICSSPPASTRRLGILRNRRSYSVGLCGLSSQCFGDSQTFQALPPSTGCV